MKRIAIVNPKRTAIGSFNGSLSTVSASDLGKNVIESCLECIDKSKIQEVFMGNVLQAGNGQNPARQSAIGAGIPVNVPASTINTVCGSSLHTVAMAYNSILAGQIEIAVAGGMENMSSSPYLLKSGRNGYRIGNGEVVDSMVADGLTCPINAYHMGITAENIAEKYNISREEQDQFAASSQAKATKAKNNNIFKDEIVPIPIKKRSEEIVFDADEFIREGTTAEKLAKLKPAFKKDGSVTPGNASGINDGAAAMVVMTEEKCTELNLKPAAFINGYSLVGVDPAYMGIGPVDAVKTLLKNTNMSIEDIDLFELNEAFASQSLAVLKELEIDSNKVNVNGGAIAMGHPIGASGSRVLVTLIHELIRSNKKYGIASLCIGTGMGIAMLIENPNA